MHHTIVAGKIRERDQSNIFTQFSVGRNDFFPPAIVEQAKIASGDSVPSPLEEVHKMSPDITAVTGDENFHVVSLSTQKSNDYYTKIIANVI
jgi:hypothetical protein